MEELEKTLSQKQKEQFNEIIQLFYKTEEYYDKKYGSSAYYDIVDSTELDIDNSRCISLNNVSIDGLKIINKNSTRTDEHLMLKIINAENIYVTNCKIEATTDKSNKDRRVTRL